MKKTILLLVILLFLPTFAYAQACVYFFYGEGCHFCAQVEPKMEELMQNPAVDIHVFEIYNNRSQMGVMSDYMETYNVPQNQRGVPAVFIADKALVGYKEILDNIDKEIERNPNAPCPKIGDVPVQSIGTLSILTVIGAALVDSINPCAIAVLLILLGALLATGDKKRAIRAGFAFTLSIYIVYFLFGIGLFSALQISGLSYWFYKVIGIFAIIIGLANLKDFFWYGGGGFVMEIPRRWRPTLKKLLHSVTTPFGAFLIGFVVCLFELPCTGGPYLFILGLLAEKTTRAGAIPILLLYNLFFVLPLIVITLFVHRGFTTIESATQWKERNIRILHLIAGLIMLVLGLLVLLGFV